MKTEPKMSRISIPESDYLAIKREMKEKGEQKFIDYLNRIRLQRQDLEDRCFHLGIKVKDLESQKSKAVSELKKAKEHNIALSEELAKSNNKITKKEAELNELIDVLNGKNREIDYLNNTLQQSNQSCSRYKSMLDDKIVEIATLSDEIKKKEQSMLDEFNHVKQENSKLEEINRVKEIRIGELEEELKSLRTFKGRIKNLFSK